MRSSLAESYRKRKKQIQARLDLFKRAGKMGGKRLFEELAFCLLTPQSKALSCDSALKELKRRGLLYGGSAEEIAAALAKKVRFHNKKAEYLVLARESLGQGFFRKLEEISFLPDSMQAREWLVKNVKGMGWKEASHYLRNIGRGDGIAILDRHILKNLKKHNAIRSMPKTLTAKKYLLIEKKMEEFCRKRRIPMAHLDLLFWSEETGKVFK
ncbi:MAG: N-glycosylase/DNA lyase [Candidatus Micrarchaeota archaeon]|nr:N-glycosylase/DNA lyase [Candidatus Micrarchaeota archaeon]